MMPDISMCRNKECPERMFCYRYRAIPNERWQSYAEFKYGENGCEDFWPITKGESRVRVPSEDN